MFQKHYHYDIESEQHHLSYTTIQLLNIMTKNNQCNKLSIDKINFKCKKVGKNKGN